MTPPTPTIEEQLDTICRHLADNVYPPMSPNDYADEAGYNDAAGDYEFNIGEAKEQLSLLITKERIDAKISVVNGLAHKVTPTDEDTHPEYSKGFDGMKSKVKFELQRLRKLATTQNEPNADN